MSNPPVTALLSLGSQRDKTIARLSDLFAHDVMTVEEFEHRVTLAHSARTVQELTALTADHETAELEPAPAPVVALVPATDAPQKRSLVAVMGGAERRGRWTCPSELNVTAVMGGVELDFREAILPPGVVNVHIKAFMGGVSVVVAPHQAVEVDGNAFLGGFAHLERHAPDLDATRSVIRIQGMVLLGGVDVRTMLPGESRRDAKHRRRLQRREAKHALKAARKER